jgi:hypothetical protein
VTDELGIHFDNGPWLESHGYRRFVALRLQEIEMRPGNREQANSFCSDNEFSV